MGNKITDHLRTGTIGELLVQLRLLELGVQAAPPLKDTGNDLIAVRGEAFRGVQIKTTAVQGGWKTDFPEYYHIVAFVSLFADEAQIHLDKSEIFLVSRAEIEKAKGVPKNLARFKLSQTLVEDLFKVQVVL